MIWLIGNRGMLGRELEALCQAKSLSFISSDREVDITDEEALRSYGKRWGQGRINWIINCAAYTNVDRSEDEPDIAFKINADGALNIALVANFLNARLIHISTDYVFNGKKKSEYLEEDRPNPIGIYGKSKWKGEENIVRNLDKHYIIRTAWLYGRYGKNFVNTMLQLFKKGERIRVVSDQWGSPTYAADLSAVIHKIIQLDLGRYGLYHCTNMGRTSWYDFAKKIHDIASRVGLIKRQVEIIPVKTKDYITAAIRPENSCLSNEKIMSSFKLSIRAWPEALEEYLKIIA